MALEDTVAKYTVQIVQTGTTAPTVQQLNDVRAAAQSVNTSFAATKTAAAETASSFENLGGKVYFVRSSIDAVRFAAMNGGTRAGFYAIDEAIRAMIQSGLKMGTIIPVFGLIGAAIAGGVLVWHEWTSAEDAAIKKAKDLAEAYKALPALLKQVSDFQKAGLLTPSEGGEYSDYLTGRKKLYTDPNGNITKNPTSQVEQPTYSGVSPVGIPIQTGTQTETVQNKIETDQAKIAKWVQDQETAGGAVTQTQADALNKLGELAQKINEQSLTGIAKEKAAIHDRYQAERDEIEQTLKVAGAQLGDINVLSPKKEQAAKAAYNQTYVDENTADNALQQKSEAVQEKGGYAQFDAIIKQMQAADALLKQGNAETEQTLAEIRQTAEAKQKALDEVTTKTRELQRIENEVTLSNLTGEAKKQEAIKQTTDAMIQQYTELATALGISQKDQDAEIAKIKSGQQIEAAHADAQKNVKDINQMANQAGQEFSSGFASAFVAFADGTKTAKQAFEEFAVSFLERSSEMIIQQLLLNAIGHTGSGGAGGSGILGAIFSADGGIFAPRKMADGGFAGTLSSATYFPRFNVVAGEAGTEMMAVLARPTFRSIGGMDAVVGHAGPNRLAIMSADDLARRNGGGAGGHLHIQIDHTPETQARIVSQAIDGAEVRVTKNMTRNTKFRQAVRSGTTT